MSVQTFISIQEKEIAEGKILSYKFSAIFKITKRTCTIYSISKFKLNIKISQVTLKFFSKKY